MIGSGDEEHIITKVLPGTAPLQDYEEDDPSQVITIDYETDDSDDVDDLSESEVSMTSAGGITKEEFQGLLGDITATHQKMAASIDALVARVGGHVYRTSRRGSSHSHIITRPCKRAQQNYGSV